MASGRRWNPPANLKSARNSLVGTIASGSNRLRSPATHLFMRETTWSGSLFSRKMLWLLQFDRHPFGVIIVDLWRNRQLHCRGTPVFE
jgi:hypothetical protein